MKIVPVSEEYLTNAINGLVSEDMLMRGECPGNLSFWNPGKEYKAFMSERISLPMEDELFDYIYSCSLYEYLTPMLNRIGAGWQQETTLSLTPSSTISIVQVMNLMRQGGLRRICILAPMYFSVRSCCRAFGFEYDTVPLVRDDAGWHLPVARILEGKYDALWVTSPIYGTGETLSDEMLADILRLRDEHDFTVVFDESLALPGQELIRRVDIDDATVFIYSPHKAISINSRKFSVIACHWQYSQSLNDWTDVFAGSLPRSCIGAFYHYLSDNYHDVCVPAYRDFVRRREEDLAAAIAPFSWAHTYPHGSGHYRTVFTDVPMPPDERILEIAEKVRERTGCIFYPSTMTGFTREAGLAFRVNLLLDRDSVRNGVASVLSCFEQMK